MALDAANESPPSPSSSALDSLNPSDKDASLQHSDSTPSTPRSSPESSTILADSSSSLPTLSVKFAPLPELAPRKRRSTAPLGMAARGQLVRRRRNQPDSLPNSSPILSATNGWTDEELDQQRKRYEVIAARNALAVASINAREVEEELLADEDDEGDAHHHYEPSASSSSTRHSRRAGKGSDTDTSSADDPFLALGRIVKGAGKTLWKRVASKDLAAAKGKYKEAHDSPDSDQGLKRQSDPGPSSPSPSLPAAPPRPILAPLASSAEASPASPTAQLPPEDEPTEEGGVWEEEIGDTFPINVSQTATFVEGRPIYTKATTVDDDDVTVTRPNSSDNGKSKIPSPLTRVPSLVKSAPFTSKSKITKA